MAKSKKIEGPNFKTAKGNETDIFHSQAYRKSKYPMRQAMAFNKPFLDGLSERDRNLMRGYAQAKVEEMQAYKYHHKDYERMENPKNRISTNDIAAHFNKF